MEQFDLVVIGSGPAGAAAAMTGRRLGLTVALIDKRAFPRDKLCGGLFTGRSETAMQDIFGLQVTPEHFVTSRHMRFSSGPETLAEMTDAPPVHLTMRRDLDAMLHDAAVRAGAVPLLGHGLDSIDEAQSSITLKGGTQIAYKVLVGADSVNSIVARHLFGRPFDPATIGFGLEIESPPAPDRDTAVEVDFGATEWGYGWSFPKHKSVTVGVGGINVRNPDMKARLASYVDLTGSDATKKYKGHFIPFGDFRKTPGRGNVLLAGDAAGLVDPITGEGIALAMESGAHAAHAAAHAITHQTDALDDYITRLKPIHRSLSQAKYWRLVMFPKPMQGAFNAAFRKGSSLQHSFLDLLAGKADYHDLRSEFLRRIPKFLWRTARHHVGRLVSR